MANRFLWETIGVIVLTFLVTLSINDFYLVPGVKQGLIAITVIAQVFLIGLLIVMLTRPEWLSEVRAGAKKLAFIVALAATSGSLFYSEIAQYTPCTLCWYQRIFMYPLVLLLGIALFKKEDIKEYVAPMTIIGGLIAVYHYGIQIMKSTGGCPAGGACATPWIFHLGYITIPMMAFTAFLLITVLLFLSPEYEKKAPKPKKKKSKKSKK